MKIAIPVYCTPKDLREIADKLENIGNEAKVGECTTARYWTCEAPKGMLITVEFTLDQDRYRKQTKGL